MKYNINTCTRPSYPELRNAFCFNTKIIFLKDHLLPEEERDLVGKGEGPEADRGMISQHMNTMMEAMSRIVGTPGVIGDRARVHNFRGRGSGGYNDFQMDNQYDAGVYNEEFPRGRGHGRGPRGRGQGFRSNRPFLASSGTAAAVGA